MTTKNYSLSLTFEQVLELVKQLPRFEKTRLMKEIEKSDFTIDVDHTKIREILRIVRPMLNRNLGKYTHKKASEDWSFYGLAFTHSKIGYVFGFNVGFFKSKDEELYDLIGMNVLIRTGSEMPELNEQHLVFFRKHLREWINRDERPYSNALRDEHGVELARYRNLWDFKNDEEMIEFLKECMDAIHQIYPLIAENKNNIFDGVVRASPPWKEGIVEMCKSHA